MCSGGRCGGYFLRWDSLGLLLVCGTTGYMLLEGMSVIDALYRVVVTISTVGFGEINPPSPATPPADSGSGPRRRDTARCVPTSRATHPPPTTH